MALTVKFRFMRMVSKWQPLTRDQLTRRALGQLRPLKMVQLTRLIKTLLKIGFIEVRANKTNKCGVVPDIFTITDLGKRWVLEKDGKIK